MRSAFDRRIGEMITAEYPDAGLDEATWVLGRQPRLSSRIAVLIQDAPVAAFAGAFLGCLTTLCFSAFGIAPDVASALATALLSSLLLVKRTTCLSAGAFFPSLYGGAFAGMTPILWLVDNASGHPAASTGAWSISLSIVCGLAFFFVVKLDTRSVAPIGAGCGGRLGAIATVASFLFIELAGALGADANRFHSAGVDAFDIESWSAILGFFACLAGILGTSSVLRHQRIADRSEGERIFIASAVALSGLMILHLGNPRDAGMLDAFYAGCFLGMSTLDRLKGLLQPVFGAFVLTVLLVPVRALLHGFGGSLGLAAFITATLLVGLSRAAARDMLTRGISLGAAIASAMIAVFLPVGGLTTADPPAGEAPGAVGTTASEPIAGRPEATSARLVIGKASPGAVDDAIPLGLSLVNAADDDVVVLSGLPPGSNMTNGHPLASGGWHLLARELANAAIRPAQGFVGGTDATVELRHADQTIDRQSLHLEWTDIEPPLTTALSTGQRAGAVTEDHEAVLHEFSQFTGRSVPEALPQPRPAELGIRTARNAAGKMAGRVKRRGGQDAAPTGQQGFALLLDGGYPLQPRTRRSDHGNGQK